MLKAEPCSEVLTRLDETFSIKLGGLALDVFDTQEGFEASRIVQTVVYALRDKKAVPYSWGIVDEQITIHAAQGQIFPLVAGFAAGLRVAGMPKQTAVAILASFLRDFSEDVPAEHDAAPTAHDAGKQGRRSVNRGHGEA